MKLKLTPIQQAALTLIVIAIGTFFISPLPKALLHLASTLGFALILFWLFTIISKKQKNIWNTVVSGLIIFLVMHYGLKTESAIYPLIATFVTIFSKFFLQYKGSSIINPAVFGLLVTYIVTLIVPNLNDLLISWWGTNYQLSIGTYHLPFAFIVLIIWIFFSMNMWRKYPALISFLITNLALIALQQKFDFLKFTFIDGTIYFLAAIMLCEPKSSPLVSKQQIVFGIIAAVAYNGLLYLNVPYYELWAIAIANVYFFGTKMIKLKQNAV